MKSLFSKSIMAAGAIALILPLAGCRVEQTQEGEMPDVDVSVEKGALPKFDVDGPKVNVGTKEVTVKTPDIDVSLPGDDDYEEEGGEN